MYQKIEILRQNEEFFISIDKWKKGCYNKNGSVFVYLNFGQKQ